MIQWIDNSDWFFGNIDISNNGSKSELMPGFWSIDPFSSFQMSRGQWISKETFAKNEWHHSYCNKTWIDVCTFIFIASGNWQFCIPPHLQFCNLELVSKVLFQEESCQVYERLLISDEIKLVTSFKKCHVVALKL